MTLNDFKPLK